MNKWLFLIIPLTLLACTQVNSSSEKNITNGADTLSKVDISVSKTEGLLNLTEELEHIEEKAASKLLFKASGSEPGWFGEIYNNKLRLIVDYGKDSLILEDSFDGFNPEKNYNLVKAITYNGKATALSLNLTKGNCTSASGDVESYSVSLKLNNKSYKGCGSMVK